MKKHILFTITAFLIFVEAPGSYAKDHTQPINVISATYGGNCGVRRGNATSHIARHCNGRLTCQYTVNYRVIGDPAYGCEKDYIVKYRCGRSGIRTATLLPEAGWGNKSVTLRCRRHKIFKYRPTSNIGKPLITEGASSR